MRTSPVANPLGTLIDVTRLFPKEKRQEARVSLALTQPEVMNLDDDSYLSAYLDDELDPADRLAIEWSIESSPALGEQLRSLCLARDSVAGLDRPGIPCDLAPIVAARLASNRRKARRQSLGRPFQIALGLSGFSAIAASLIFALILLNHSLHPTELPNIATNRQQVPANQPQVAVDPANPSPATAAQPTELASKRPPLLPRAGTLPTPPTIDHPSLVAGLVDEAKEQGNRKSMDRMLEREHVWRIVIVTDVFDGPDRVKQLIDQYARKTPEYARVKICQEIVLDSGHPEAAEVFAVPMDEQGRRAFVDKLGRQFPDLVEERDSRPELITKLSEVGQLAIFRGTEAAPLGDPPFEVRPFIASRTNNSPDHIVDATGAVDSTGSAGGSSSSVEKAAGRIPGGQGSVASNDPSFVGPRNPYRVAPPRPGDPITLIVWVTRPPRH
jgi:hypothetical protein